MKTQLVDQIIRPKTEGGCDWGVKRKVLVRLVVKGVAVKELWWMPGYTGWAGVSQTDYYNANLRIVEKFPGPYKSNDAGGAASKTTMIAEKGRLTRKRILDLTSTIDTFFGYDVSRLIDLHKTLIIEN